MSWQLEKNCRRMSFQIISFKAVERHGDSDLKKRGRDQAESAYSIYVPSYLVPRLYDVGAVLDLKQVHWRKDGISCSTALSPCRLVTGSHEAFRVGIAPHFTSTPQLGKNRFFDGDFLIMASPVSIGDAILLAQIAYKIGLAFTTGRKSAPAEFEEIQKLLWTLSEALKLVAREFPETGQTGTAESSEGCGKSKEEEEPGAKALLITLISNCQGVLKHLDHLVKKYSDLDPKAVGIRDSERRCWKDDFWRNWKKVKWTKEGGGLDTLKKSLNVHLAGLNLALSAINK